MSYFSNPNDPSYELWCTIYICIFNTTHRYGNLTGPKSNFKSDFSICPSEDGDWLMQIFFFCLEYGPLQSTQEWLFQLCKTSSF